MSTVELSTPDKLEYNYYPVSGGSLHFTVKTPNDAHIALTQGPSETDSMYEIFIGGWNNSKSVIRKNRQKPDKAIQETPNILTADEAKGFWIRWNGGSIALGKKGEAEPFLSWDDPEPFPVTHYGICTGWGASGEWVIEAPKSEPGWNLDNIESTGPAKWTAASGGEIPPNAIPAGIDNEQLYVGRANHEGAILPGKVVPSHGVCYVPWGGAEHGIPEYEVLCGCDATWMPATAGEVPSGALPSGETEDGEILYVGRAQHEGVTSIGKVQGSHKVCYIPFGGQEIAYPEYEVLVAK
ncbi:C3 and PZP-like alpha-2-macroglobulin domain-containing protein 8 isoform X2 [Lycorma delicatula]|uniref:C3 and PZP-like alpha-2-macroglobulin domain-containing protein 8 isoform X2 n=1 Tax=Lycorma delicatula TaxID=130591 RepID=UPI003F50D589